ncbi:hypothetical protein GUJ93_ZPchr0011g27730 [Zizania palustris]|uniref:Uncharacterized protein n=1 Tax=Zizania palustris TaxID=103762 RepID=A0A8J5WIV6_ZIZPA|nr:hypothetical protein GUJ93_ZPchr0011g27730 [Zizania palustris]
MQSKVNLFVDLMGQFQQDQEVAMRRGAVQNNVHEAFGFVHSEQNRSTGSVVCQEQVQHLEVPDQDLYPRRPGMPRMDFPKFDGSGARVWVDNCMTYFEMYQIPEGFKVFVSSLNLTRKVPNWYKTWKYTLGRHDWLMF